MKKELTYATVCSGIECCSVACRGLPLKPVFFSEIEPYPCAVLKSHYPDIPNLGDMSKIRRDENGNITNGRTTIAFPDGGIDILAAGCPCQDFSVAGKRAGGEEGSGTRSSLVHEFIRIVGEIRPRWFIYENVVGMLSTNEGRDFAHILLAFRDCGYGVAYRTLDAQYVRVDGMERAVPQRRRRVWVVGCLGEDVARAASILFEPDGVVGDSAPRRRTGQGFAYSLEGRDRVDARVVESAPGAGGEGDECIALDGDKLKPRVDQRKGGNGFGINEEGAGYTLTGVDRHGVAYGIDQQGGKGGANTTEGVAPTVLSDSHGTPHIGARNGEISGAFTAVECYEVVGFKAGQSKDGGLGDEREVSPTLSHKPSALEPTLAQSTFVRIGSMTRRDRPTPPSEEVAHALTKTDGDAGDNAASVVQSLASMRYIVRRLTPTEAERLMGLPSGYTIPRGLQITDELVAEFQRIHDTFGAIMAEYEHTKPPKPKPAKRVAAWLKKIANPATCPDSPRYRVCGNGWATNQPRWILTRLLHQEGVEW